MSPIDPSPSPSPSRRRGRKPRDLSPETREEIVRLAPFYQCRGIARRVLLDRKIVARVLAEEGLRTPSTETSEAGKLEPFLDQIEGRVAKRITTTRILREIREIGYREAAPSWPSRCAR